MQYLIDADLVAQCGTYQEGERGHLRSQPAAITGTGLRSSRLRRHNPRTIRRSRAARRARSRDARHIVILTIPIPRKIHHASVIPRADQDR